MPTDWLSGPDSASDLTTLLLFSTSPLYPQYHRGCRIPAERTELALFTSRLIYVHSGKSTDALSSKHEAQGLDDSLGLPGSGPPATQGAHSSTCVFSDLAVVTELFLRLLRNCYQADGISPIYDLTLIDLYAAEIHKYSYCTKHRMKLDMVLQWIPS